MTLATEVLLHFDAENTPLLNDFIFQLFIISMKNYVHIWASLKLSTEALLPLIILGTPVIRLSCTKDLATLINLAVDKS